MNEETATKVPTVTITGHKTIICPAIIIWRDYEIMIKEIMGVESITIRRKDGKGKATLLSLEQATNDEKD